LNIPHQPHPAFQRASSPARGLLPPATLPVAAALLVVGGIGPHPVLALMAIVVLVAGCTLLWRPGESPILLFTFAYPWLQASAAIFHANWLGVDIGAYSTVPGDMQNASILSLLGTLTLAVGMRLGAGPRQHMQNLAAHDTAASQPMKRWGQLYAVAWVVSLIAMSSAWVAPGLSQPMLALATLRWAFFFMLAFAHFVRDRGLLFPFVFLLELATSIGGYFSDFKTVFFVTLFAMLARSRISLRAQLSAGVLAVLTGTFGVLWTAVKTEYRVFASGGHAEQVVTVDYAARLGKLYELIAKLDFQALPEAADQLLRRVAYVEFFGAVLVYVPANLPHTAGAIFWDAIVRPFMPRILFPDKDVIDDTARTNFYTGGLAGTSEGTSISLGYVAEAYIDFGMLGMFGALLVVGVFFGVIYRILTRWRRSRGLLGMAMATAVLTSAGALESSITKTFGSVITSLLVAWALTVFVMPRWAPWLVVNGRR
jgi:hypothetical protein